MTAKRDPSIDFMRALGLILIVVAHVNSPDWAVQLRCFDVPMMVFVSGLSYAGRKVEATRAFFVKRTLRLVLPVWMFFGLVFIPASWIGQLAGLVPDGFVTLRKNVGAFLLLNDGYGYAWIIRVFLLIMLATPMLVCLNERIKSLKAFFAVLAAVFVLDYACVKALYMVQEGGIVPASVAGVADAVCFVVDQYWLYFLGYSTMFLLGLRMRSLQASAFTVGSVSVAVLVLAAAALYLHTGQIRVTPMFKYPPYLYFLVYGGCMSCLLWACRRSYARLSAMPMFGFIGRNTIWIYMWHIPFVYVCNSLVDGWVLRYAIVITGAIAVYYVQYRIAMCIDSRFSRSYLVG